MASNMCAASVIMDYGSKIPIWKWTQDAFDKYKYILDKIKEWDEEIGEPDCEDESKGQWIEEIEQKINKRKKMQSEEVSVDSIKYRFNPAWQEGIDCDAEGMPKD
jgi:hypothetical protein